MIYFIQAGENGPIKIGSANNPQERANNLQIGCPDKLRVIFSSQKYTEQEMQKKFSADEIRGEWFKPDNIFEFLKDLEKAPPQEYSETKKCFFCDTDHNHIISVEVIQNEEKCRIDSKGTYSTKIPSIKASGTIIRICYHCKNDHFYIEQQEFHKGRIYIAYHQIGSPGPSNSMRDIPGLWKDSM